MPVDPRRRAATAASAAAASDSSTNGDGSGLPSVDGGAGTGSSAGAAQEVPPTTTSVSSMPPESTLSDAAPSSMPSSSHRSILLQHEDEREEEDEDVNMAYVGPGSDATTTAASGTAAAGSSALPLTSSYGFSTAAVSEEERELISRIITPSPFEQHNTGSNRFRNALTRVSNDPTGDAEAWQIIASEASTGYKTILDVHAVDAETLSKLDWVESCYGALLSNFPLAAPYVATVAELLFAQSARAGEEHGPVHGYYATAGGGASRRSVRCEAKLERLLSRALGVNFDENNAVPADATTNGNTNEQPPSSSSAESFGSTEGMCGWYCDLWLIYVAKAARDASRRVRDEEQRTKLVRDATLAAYEKAVARAGFGHNNHLLWRQYVAFVKSWTAASPSGGGGANLLLDHALQQQQMVQLRSAYQRIVSIPMTGLDSLFQEYEAFERSHSEALATALLAELTPKYQHARTIYLERSRVYGGPDLISNGRTLATDPVHHRESSLSSSSSRTAQKQAGDDKAGDDQEDSSAARLEEEHKLLKAWKVRCAYERTNPERLTTKDMHQRCISAYHELVCTWARHPECWHMWSMYELSQHAQPAPSATAGAKPDAPATAGTGSQRAMSVLQLAQLHIPDCTLLAFAEARLVETQSDQPSKCIQVMERFIDRSPNTLAFVLCQRMVRRYQGADAARAVFARARRVLADDPSDRAAMGPTTAAAVAKRKSVVVDASAISEGNDDDDAQAIMDAEAAAPKEESNHTKKNWSVTNRLDESIQPSLYPATGDAVTGTVKPPVTWHLYVSHALIEHRLNRSPDVAARVYELGLRKHASFLTKPGYVSSYAQLLLELGDPVNLRALLTRSIAACEEAVAASKGEQQDMNPRGAAVSASASLPVLWDLYLRFESVLSGGDPLGATRLQEIERKRREVVMGSDIEDVATGGLLNTSDVALIGAQKSTISEQLVRTEGYDVSSSIVSGMSRVVDLLETMGLWGNDTASLSLSARAGRQDKDLDLSGGVSDASYHKRLRFQTLAASGFSTEAAALEGVAGGGGAAKHMSARERMQQSAAGASALAAGQPTAMMLAIQQSPEWLRPLLLLLPASRLRLPIVSKPPIHMTELALSTLRVNQLPAERPIDTSSKRKTMNGGGGGGGGGGGDSSDEEDAVSGQGYGDLFRNRQRARLAMNSTTD